MRRLIKATVLVATCVLSFAVEAADKIKVVSSNKGLWDTTLFDYGRQKGIFKDADLELEVVFVQGSGSQVLQTIIAGGGDIGIGVASAAALGAVTKRAPVTIISKQFTGASDMVFMAHTSSTIKGFRDLEGQTLGISARGSSTETVAALLAQKEKVSIKMVATGGPAATVTQVLTKQVTAGWSGYPVGMDKVEAGELRIIAHGNDAPGMAEQNSRVAVGSAAFVNKNDALVKKFLMAYGKVLEWAYSTDEALQMYADAHKISLDSARKIVAMGYPRSSMDTGRVGSLDIIIKAAVDNKALDAPLSAQELEAALKFAATIAK